MMLISSGSVVGPRWKTQKESGNPPKVFLKSPYGLQYRPDHKDWIPFRHGPVNL